MIIFGQENSYILLRIIGGNELGFINYWETELVIWDLMHTSQTRNCLGNYDKCFGVGSEFIATGCYDCSDDEIVWVGKCLRLLPITGATSLDQLILSSTDK